MLGRGCFLQKLRDISKFIFNDFDQICNGGYDLPFIISKYCDLLITILDESIFKRSLTIRST